MFNFYKKVFHFFDRFEDKIRGKLSKKPIIYSLVGGIAVVLFWRGIWHTGDLLESKGGVWKIFFSGPGSIIVGLALLLALGLFVSVFVGDQIIMSGIKSEKKLVDKTQDEIKTEDASIEHIGELLLELKGEVDAIESMQEKINSKFEDHLQSDKK